MPELTVGQVIDGRYELEAVIGKGGMGCVFRARHVITHGKVAFKLLTDTVDAELKNRFLAEARAASTIGHPAIVSVTDAGTTADGQLYLVMELLAGKPLRSLLRTGLPGDQIRRVGLEMLDALGAAHARGIVHRDLKPENIYILAGTGAIKILDFGIAKVLGASSSTVSGFVLGTIEYMAPEQLLDAAAVDGRADLWAIGIMLYELIAGVRPFGGTTREAKYAALATEDPMPIEDIVPVTPDVAAFFARALARDPAQRFQTAAEMSAALRGLSMVPQTASHTAQSGASATLGTGAAQWASGPATHTHGTPRPPPGSIPPPDSTSPGHLRQPGPPPPRLQQVAPPVATGNGKKIALVALAVVAVFGIAFGIAMGVRGGKPVAPADAALEKPPADATPPKRDATVVVTKPPVVVAGRSCEDHCAKLEECGLAQTTCISTCDRPAVKQCLDSATDCAQRAGCYWNSRCNRAATVNGSMTCSEFNGCFDRYQFTDVSVGCQVCVDKMSAPAALAAARIKVCQDNALASPRDPNDPTNPSEKCDKLYNDCR